MNGATASIDALPGSSKLGLYVGMNTLLSKIDRGLLPTFGVVAAVFVATLMVFRATVAEAQAPDVGLPSPAASSVQPRMGEGVAIEVNGQAVSSYDVFQRVKWLLYWSRLRPTEAVLLRVEDEARRMLVDESLQISELRRLGAERGVSFIVPDADVERRIDRLARQRKLTGAALLSQLVDEDIDSATIYEMFRAQMSWDSFVQSRYAGRITLKPERVSGALELQARNLERDSFRLREIALPAQGEGRSQGGMVFAEALWSTIVKGEATFGDIAIQFSIAPSASKGGEIGWIGLDDLPAGARPTIAQMIPGQISPPLEVDGQLFIYFVDDFSPAGGKPKLDLYSVSMPANSPNIESEAAMLATLKRRAATCADLEALKSAYPAVVFEKLNGVTASSISPDFRPWLVASAPNESSPVTRTRSGIGFVFNCRQYREKPALETEGDVQERLYLEQLILLSKRDLRNLRQSSLVVHRY